MSGILQARVMSVGAMKQRMQMRSHGKPANITSFPTLNEVLVKDTNIDLGYMKQRDYFASLLAAEQTRPLVEQGTAENMSVIAMIQPGRRFDRVVIVTLNPNAPHLKDQVKQEIRYFIESSTGTIFGPKSDKAPNPRQYYGTLDTVDDWDWSGVFGEPKDLKADSHGDMVSQRAGVKRSGKYGIYYHYEPLKKKATQKA